MMKRLFLCRHAKSSWKDTSLADIDRPLNKRGRKNAPEMGRRLAARDVKPDLILSSPARRALKTARLIARELGIDKSAIVVIDALYDSFPVRLLQVVREMEGCHEAVMLVGHNPEMTMLANILGDLDIENVPTCGIVALDFTVESWRQVDEGNGILVFFDYPKMEGGTDLF